MRPVGKRTRPLSAIAAALICCSSSVAVSCAQDADPAEPPAARTLSPAGDVTAQQRQLILFQNDDGELEAAPYSEEELRKRFAPEDVESPIAPVYISELLLDGFVDGDRALLTATISIEVTATGAFDVPLRLNQAHVWRFHHDGPGPAAPILETQHDDGLHWRLEGQGTHRLELSFWVLLKTSPAGHQLLLTLPALPEYLVTRISLKIPGDQLVVRRPPEIVDLQQVVGDDGNTDVTAEIESQRLDLTWAERRQSADTLSSVRTMMTLRRDGDQLVLGGEQEIAVEQGDVSEVELRLPVGFEPQDVFLVGARDQTALDHHRLPDDARSLRVILPEPLHQKFTLTWTLQRAFPEQGGIVPIDGLEVAKAGNSQGELLIETVDGYRVLWNEDRSQGVRRMTVRDESARGTAWGGFKFDGPRFHLELEFDPITPETDVDLAYYLRVNADELLLTLDVSVQVLTGSVGELRFLWPERNEQQWAVVDRRIQTTSDGDTVQAVFDDEQSVLTLARPVAGALGARLRFRRELPEEQTGVDLTLPQVNGTWLPRPVLFVAEAIDVTAELTHASGRRTPIATSDEFGTLPTGFVDDSVRAWELADSDTSLHLTRTRHPRSVTVATSVTLGSPEDSVLLVTEEFSCEVAWGRMESMLFDVPDEILEVYPPETAGIGFRGGGLQFSDEEGNSLTSTFDGHRYTVSLPRRHGEFRVRLEFALALPPTSPGSHEEYQLPIVQPVDADVTRTAVYADPASTLGLIALDPEWQSILDRSGGSVWYAAGNRDTCRLEFRFAGREFVQRLDIEACFLQTQVSESGSAKTYGVYLLEHPPAEVLIALPPGHSESEFYWGDELLPPSQDSGNDPYLLTLPETAQSAESGWLSVAYQSEASADSGALAQTNVEFPSFGPDVRINETIWEVVLPHRQLLSHLPVGMRPEFTWQRKAVLWMRSPTAYVLERRNEILKDAGGGMLPLTQSGYGYAFSANGSVPYARIESMSQSLVVLTGAGLTLLLGFVFGRFPTVRSMYSLLVLAFLFSLIAVWHLDLMQLLVQPAVIGLCLAILAVKFDTATRGGSVFRKDQVSSQKIGSEVVETVSPVPGGVSSGVARTALYPAADPSNSGSHPHD